MTYVKTDAPVAIGLTERQASILHYVLSRAQEDPRFFDSLVGESDAHVRATFAQTLVQIKRSVDQPLHRLMPVPAWAG